MKVILRDKNPSLVEAWKGWFKDEAGDVEIECGGIFDSPADAVVSPANSFALMNGGIDQVYTDRFGLGVQETLQEIIQRDHWGELPVGQAVIVWTLDKEFPHLICAPTMRVPEQISKTLNAYHAFRAARMAVERWNEQFAPAGHEPIESIVCPGLGTGVGKLDYELCARQMLCAYRAPVWPGDCSEDFTTPWSIGRFMRGEGDMAGVTPIRPRKYKVVHES